MNRLDTPLAPEARTVKAGAGAAGKDQLKRLQAGDRDGRGSAFDALFKSLDQRPADEKAPAADKARMPAAASSEANEDKVKATADMLAVAEAPADPGQIGPRTDPVASAAALLSAFQPSERKVAETGGNSERAPASRMRQAAGAHADVFGDIGRAALRDSHDRRIAQPEPIAPSRAGPAMPSEGKAPAPDLSVLTRLAEALKDPNAPKDPLALDASLPGLAETDEDGKPAHSARGSENAASPAPLIIAVTHQETHLPPVLKLSPFQQVVEPIRQAAAELVASSRAADAIPELDSTRPTEISAPTKLLHIELRPVELGTITVKLRLTQSGMEMRIEASKAETATMLGQDKEALREIIRASGYSPDAVSVETVHVDAMPGDWQRAQHRQDAAEGQTPDGRDGGRGFDEFRQGEQGRDAPRQGWTQDAPLSKDEPHDMAETGRAGSDPHLYL